MKRITVTLTDNKSKDLPIYARFRLNRVDYSLAFEDERELQHWFNCRFYPARIIYKDKREQMSKA